MKKQYYILNTKNGMNFDTMEMKFYTDNWTPYFEDDKDFLEKLIASDPERFENCIVIEVEAL